MADANTLYSKKGSSGSKTQDRIIISIIFPYKIDDCVAILNSPHHKNIAYLFLHTDSFSENTLLMCLYDLK